MKLNNNGWSFGTMLALLTILILALLLVFFFMHKSGIDTDKEKYNNYEEFNLKL